VAVETHAPMVGGWLRQSHVTAVTKTCRRLQALMQQ
jgi:hypothetical protein